MVLIFNQFIVVHQQLHSLSVYPVYSFHIPDCQQIEICHSGRNIEGSFGDKRILEAAGPCQQDSKLKFLDSVDQFLFITFRNDLLRHQTKVKLTFGTAL